MFEAKISTLSTFQWSIHYKYNTNYSGDVIYFQYETTKL